MINAANELLSAAMTLSESERAELAAPLLDTLNPSVADGDYARAWEAELLQRIRDPGPRGKSPGTRQGG